jgi:hypothetical protein
MKSLVLNFPDDLDFDTREMTAFIAAKLYATENYRWVRLQKWRELKNGTFLLY